jgi:hypothetical protein
MYTVYILLYSLTPHNSCSRSKKVRARDVCSHTTDRQTRFCSSNVLNAKLLVHVLLPCETRVATRSSHKTSQGEYYTTCFIRQAAVVALARSIRRMVPYCHL